MPTHHHEIMSTLALGNFTEAGEILHLAKNGPKDGIFLSKNIQKSSIATSYCKSLLLITLEITDKRKAKLTSGSKATSTAPAVLPVIYYRLLHANPPSSFNSSSALPQHYSHAVNWTWKFPIPIRFPCDYWAKE